MSISWIVNTLLGAVLLPPFNCILLAGLGLLVARKWPRWGWRLCAVALLALTALSTEFIASQIGRPLENRHAPLITPKQLDAQAIVVLSGGRLSQAPEYGGVDVPRLITLGRMRYAAYLHRASGLPVLVSGGSPDGIAEAEAALMARALQDEMGVPVRWVEGASDNTAQNAEFSARILHQAGIQKIALVTDALHMSRAHRAFEQYGMTVQPAPTLFAFRGKLKFSHFLPSARGMELSYYAMHEWLGLLWYQLHSQRPPSFAKKP